MSADGKKNYENTYSEWKQLISNKSIHTVDGTSCVTVLSGSIETPICAVCEMGCEPNTLNCDIAAAKPFVSISSSFFSVDILKMADGLEFEM